MESIEVEVKSTESKDYFLYPSTLITCSSPHMVQTILGSCVAVCLYDKRAKRGGINHYMLPAWNGKGVPSPKYGDIAIDLLFEKMMDMGSEPVSLVAKVFGGASQHGFENSSIGVRNVDMALFSLAKRKIEIVSQHVGGVQGRKILFNTHTGQVFLKHLPSSSI